jgi:spore coat polysaccharide biosynthesis predicted glycosyltransferase SpsG
MSVLPDIRVLFRAAAGAKRGFGHLVRCRSLARALGVRPLVSVGGTSQARDVALLLGCDLVTGTPQRLIRALALDLLIVDDPIASHAAAWIDAARAAGVATVSIHDLGLGSPSADLVVDGSITNVAARARRQGTAGPDYAILDPALSCAKVKPHRRDGVLIALGGGPRATLAGAIAAAIARRAPDVPIRIAGGFGASRTSRRARRTTFTNVTWLDASKGLAAELFKAEVAIVGGGVSLYEACAAGAAPVGVPVVSAQCPTIAGFIARGAALGSARLPVSAERAAEAAVTLLENDHLRRQVVRTARGLVDAHGAQRVAQVVHRFLRSRGRDSRLPYAS